MNTDSTATATAITNNSDSGNVYILDVIIALSPIALMSVYFYGARAAAIISLSILSCIFFEAIYSFITVRKMYLSNLSCIVTGLIIALCLPITISYFSIIVANFFAIFIGKMIFGGFGKNIFNPAAVGMAFLIMFSSMSVFTYVNPALSNDIGIFSTNIETQDSVVKMIKNGEIPGFSNIELFFGLTPTALGTGAIILILAALFYLRIRGTISLVSTLSAIITFSVLALLFPRLDYSALSSLKYELFSGSFLFVSVFMLNDTVTSCKTRKAKAIAGVLFAVLCIFFRHFSYLEEGSIFALLIVNAFVASLDIKSFTIYRKLMMKFAD